MSGWGCDLDEMSSLRVFAMSAADLGGERDWVLGNEESKSYSQV